MKASVESEMGLAETLTQPQQLKMEVVLKKRNTIIFLMVYFSTIAQFKDVKLFFQIIVE